MTLSVKVTKKGFKKLGGLLPAAQNQFGKELKKDIIDIIISEYNKGTSPVKGGAFNPYKKKKDGSKSTVKDTGALHKSLRIIIRKTRKSVGIVIGEGLKYARYLQDGTEKMAARPLLPEKISQKFKKGVIDKINKAARIAVEKAVKKI